VRISDRVKPQQRLHVDPPGQGLEQGRLGVFERLRFKTGAWLKGLRLQFYPMTWLAYTAGALAAGPEGGPFGNPVFWLGYLCLFLLEAATVLSNEILDFPSDRANRFFSMFSGGSRVLVEGLLSPREVRTGIAVMLTAFVVATVTLLAMIPSSELPVVIAVAVLTVLAIGYTVPPLKLSYRGLGEIDVAITHSIGVILCGFLFLGGNWQDPLPWVLSLPLLMAILPAILLSGVPDLEADAAAGKRTLAVRLGHRKALHLAGALTLSAATASVVWDRLGLADGAYAGIAYLAVPHALWLGWLLHRRLQSEAPAGRIDSLMVAALTFILWFGIVPVFRLAT